MTARISNVEGIRAAARVLGILLGVYLVLMLLWLLAGGAYRKALVAAGNALLGGVRGDREVLVMDHVRGSKPGVPERVDLVVLVRASRWAEVNGEKRWVLAKGVTTLYQPYTATAFLAALVVATPLPWRRRAVPAVAALVGLHLWMVFTVSIDVAHTWREHGDRAAGAAGRTTTDLLAFVHATLTDWPAGVFLVPLVLWLACSGSGLLRVGPRP